MQVGYMIHGVGDTAVFHFYLLLLNYALPLSKSVSRFTGSGLSLFLMMLIGQSQAGVKGTSCPIRYILLHDETNYTVNDLQNIAYSLCSGFQRATRSVQIEKFTYYANIVATRAKKWTCQMTMVLNFSQSTVELKPQVRNSMSLINSRIGSIRGMRRSSL
ncbi:hypothetical protein PPACK8108_LOCUS22588 [Phakopsora pachyrhizi]|uniref:Piwi domain-containing protein n=1 Tax=Phakopsora pachyrhizi TaxID=170000 RepID=A0AAV0BKH6_PHAPC|nr:hypothetical protein PPACK8108_LOCUS22588 [Phakopsora pachyrhizi]